MSRSNTHAMPPAALTGRELGRRRIVLGVSALSVAKAMHVHPATLDQWEHDATVLDPGRLESWQGALRICANARAVALARQGWRSTDLPNRGLRSTLALYLK